MNTVPTNRGPMTPKAVMDELTYSAYAHERRRAPHIGPSAWKQFLNNVDAMEARFQAELAIEKAAS
jgi:hypothetical protein